MLDGTLMKKRAGRHAEKKSPPASVIFSEEAVQVNAAEPTIGPCAACGGAEVHLFWTARGIH